MTMTTMMHFIRRLWSLTAGFAIVLAVLAGSPSPLQAQSVVVMVNGEPITSLDVEQRTKLNFLTTRKQMPRQEVIEELINEKVKIKEAKRFGVDPGVSDMDQAFAGMAQRMRLSPDQLTKSLESQGVRPETLKARLKAEMVWGSLVRGRFKESLQVGEKDVNDAAQGSGEPTQTDAYEYKLQPIVLIVPRGSSPAFVETRHKEAETYRARPASRPTPISSRCRMPPFATPSPRPLPTSPARFVSCWTRRRSAV
jgi:peptidyl-prolyl cis-trans isomerase SurA